MEDEDERLVHGCMVVAGSCHDSDDGGGGYVF